MRVGLLHLGQSVDFVVSMTFLRSPVFAILAIRGVFLLFGVVSAHIHLRRTASTARLSRQLPRLATFERGWPEDGRNSLSSVYNIVGCGGLEGPRSAGLETHTTAGLGDRGYNPWASTPAITGGWRPGRIAGGRSREAERAEKRQARRAGRRLWLECPGLHQGWRPVGLGAAQAAEFPALSQTEFRNGRWCLGRGVAWEIGRGA